MKQTRQERIDGLIPFVNALDVPHTQRGLASVYAYKVGASIRTIEEYIQVLLTVGKLEFFKIHENSYSAIHIRVTE